MTMRRALAVMVISQWVTISLLAFDPLEDLVIGLAPPARPGQSPKEELRPPAWASGSTIRTNNLGAWSEHEG
jgi:hypothetical protein